MFEKKQDNPTEQGGKSGNALSSVHRKRIVKSSILSAVALVIIILGIAVAWFSSSTTSEVNTLAMQAVDAPFELRTEGEPDNAELLKLLKSDVKDGETISQGVNQTSGEMNSIQWLLTSDGDDEAMYPGTSGELVFYVVPAQSGDLTLNFDLDMTAYKKSDKNDENAVQYGNEYLTEIGENEEALQLLGGHILFFEKYENGCYSGRITDGSFSVELKNAQEGNAYKVTVYWTWPYTLGQMILKSESAYISGRTPVFDDNSDEAGELINDAVENSGKYFKFEENNAVNVTEEQLTSLRESSGDEFYLELYQALSDGYNNGDQCIGVDVRYILISVTAEKA